MPTFAERVAERRARTKARPFRPKVAPQRYPKHLEQAYSKLLLQVVDRMRRAVHRSVLPLLRATPQERTDSAVRLDALPVDLPAALLRARGEAEDSLSAPKLRSITRRMAERIDGDAKASLQRQLKESLGVDVLATEPKLKAQIGQFVETNVAIIMSIPAQAFDQMEALVQDATTRGRRFDSLADDLEERLDVSESRAVLIARDQIGKAFGDITQFRQTALGIESFVWSTSGDERVRDSHDELDGEVFEWADPPEVDGEVTTPGKPIQCRCVATPFVQDLIDEVEDEEANTDNGE